MNPDVFDIDLANFELEIRETAVLLLRRHEVLIWSSIYLVTVRDRDWTLDTCLREMYRCLVGHVRRVFSVILVRSIIHSLVLYKNSLEARRRGCSQYDW